jgi:Tfp pilus assembly protein PilV
MISSSSSMAARTSRRRGAALIAALICVLLVSMMSAVLVKTALVQRDQLEQDAWQLQADWLAQSALERTIARLKTDAEYTGETWMPATAQGTPIGRVTIEIVQASGDTTERLLRATADVPDDPVRRARVVREWRLSGEKSSVSSGTSAGNE